MIDKNASIALQRLCAYMQACADDEKPCLDCVFLLIYTDIDQITEHTQRLLKTKPLPPGILNELVVNCEALLNKHLEKADVEGLRKLLQILKALVNSWVLQRKIWQGMKSPCDIQVRFVEKLLSGPAHIRSKLLKVLGLHNENDPFMGQIELLIESFNNEEAVDVPTVIGLCPQGLKFPLDLFEKFVNLEHELICKHKKANNAMYQFYALFFFLFRHVMHPDKAEKMYVSATAKFSEEQKKLRVLCSVKARDEVNTEVLHAVHAKKIANETCHMFNLSNAILPNDYVSKVIEQAKKEYLHNAEQSTALDKTLGVHPNRQTSFSANPQKKQGNYRKKAPFADDKYDTDTSFPGPFRQNSFAPYRNNVYQTGPENNNSSGNASKGRRNYGFPRAAHRFTDRFDNRSK